MAGEIDELYRDAILDHYRRPRNFGRLDRPDRAAALFNPLCGDEITVGVRLVADRVAECRFDGVGCSIAQASASMMTERVRGLSVSDALRLVERFRAFMRGERDVDLAGGAAAAELGELAAFRGVAAFPVRLKCATLAWNALRLALEGRGGGPPAPAPED